MTISRVDDQLELKRKERKSKSASMRHCEHSSAEDDGIKRFHGDGLVVRMHSNHRVLEIMGDGCRIILSKNSGSVHIVGDGCWLNVNHNVGDIEYTGDGGRVLLGPDSSKEKVKFVGDGGKIILDSNMRSEGSSGEQNRETDHVEKITYSHKKIVRKIPECEKCEDADKTSNREDMDNIVNDMKEKSQGKYGKRNEETRKSTRHPTVTKIVTKIQSDGQCVRKRFDDSSLIVNFHGDERFVTKNLSRTSSTNVKII